MKFRSVKLSGFFALLAALSATQEAQAAGWDFEIAPYLWVAGVDGDVSIKTEKIDFSADFKDILDQTKFGGSVILGANRGRWVNFLQLDYLALENDDAKTRLSREDIHLEVDSLLATATTGYRFDIGHNHSVDAMVGLRYAGIDMDVDLNRRGNRTSNRDIYDAILMIRPRVQLSDNLQLMLSFSVGGGDSDLTWEVFPELIYQPGSLKFRFGYRNLNYDNEKGNDKIDFSMHGVLLGVGFEF